MITKRAILPGDDGDRIAGLSARYLADLPACSAAKGIFSACWMVGMFAVLAHQRASQWREQDDGLWIALCRLVLLLSVGLLLVGAWYVPADWHEKSRLYRGMVCLLIWRIGSPERTRIARADAKNGISAALRR